MANPAERLPGNIAGRYHVDASCIDCDQCRAMAPEFFTRDPENGTSFVSRQPQTKAEISDLTEAMQSCALGSIGDDGA